MIRATLSWLAAILFLLTARAGRAEPIRFDTGVLPGWTTGLGPTETVPYIQEQLSSELIFGARSPAGSFLFVTKVDHTAERDAFSAADLHGFVSRSSYRDLEPTRFEKRLDRHTLGRARSIETMTLSLESPSLGYDLGQGPFLSKKVHYPLVLRSVSPVAYENLLYIANFRGAARNPEDLEAFDAFCRSFALADDGYEIVPISTFNAARSELVALREAAANTEGAEDFQPTSSPLAGEPAARLSAAFLSSLRGGAAGSAESLAELAGTAEGPLALAAARISKRSRARAWHAMSLEVWDRLGREATREEMQVLVPAFLEASIRSDSPALVREVIEKATALGLDLGDLREPDARSLLSALEEAPRLCGEAEHDSGFFALAEPGVQAQAMAWLRSRNQRLPTLETLDRRRSPDSLCLADGRIGFAERSPGRGRLAFRAAASVCEIFEFLGASGFD